MIGSRLRVLLACAAVMAAGATRPAGAPTGRTEIIDVAEPAEVIATVTASCDRCDWSVPGREAAVLRLEVDGRYSQHLFLTRGKARADYAVLLGPLSAGRHELTLTRDPAASARDASEPRIERVTFAQTSAADPAYTATSLAPILFARPNTVGGFSDVPLILWYEREETERGFRLRYSVIFSNEDGGTPAERLLATWGRLTDIEYIYGIEFDHSGAVVEETYQAKDHKILPFDGQREGRHPLLYVVTDNNMVGATGTTTQRFAPAPIPFDLSASSREEVMDANPWTYAVTAREARREGRVVKSPVPGSKKIYDPSRYAVVEACARPEDAEFATFTFALGVTDGKGPRRFFDSSVGVRDFRISRGADNFPNGCFRGAVALPRGTKAAQVTAVEVRAFTKPPGKGEPPRPPGLGPAHLRHVNKIFLMTPGDLPEPSLFSWRGDAPLPLDGAPVTLEIHPR